MKKIILPISILLLFIVTLNDCNYNSQLKHKVTFQVLVKNPSEQQKVFITGNQPELGDWEPGKILFERISDSLFTRAIYFNKGTDLAFKITTGHWWTEALDKNEDLATFNLDIEKDTVVTVTVYGWKNYFSNRRVILNQKRFKPTGQLW